ncbi:hypothetical protein C8F01DRAFT_1179498 [Mycena amicta]|nr:hypothetical protein C8F01DRAFT_1190278 [Mycena amicta]KAJ7050335.1 hypothetical protein C8F01DRAFT_1179498 [Mycena amicta]
MSAPTSPLPVFDAGPTIGALLVGTLCSYILLGVTTTQCYLYFGRFPEDTLGLKLLVGFVWLIEMAHAGCIGHVVYDYAVLNYGNPRSLLGKMPVSLGLSIVLGGIITALVQGFFAFRIWTLAPNKFVRIVPILLWISAFVYVIASFAGTALSIPSASIPAFIKQYGWLLLVPWVINLINDNVITIALVLLLLANRTKGFNKTTALVDKLIKWTIETGMITSIFSILNLAFYEKETSNFIWVGIQFVKARLFANSLLASLNSRQTLRALNATAALDSGNGATSRAAYGTTTANHGQHPTLNIAMTKVTLREGDSPEYGYKSPA